MAPANIIDHVVLLVDKSYSMNYRVSDTIRVVDGQIAELRRQSAELGREIRASIYYFDDNVECPVFDMDVLRVPSIKDTYRIGGNTALCAAAMTAVDELETTSTVRGDHSFLLQLVSDGDDNRSRALGPVLQQRLARLSDHWTVVAYVPDETAKRYAIQYGFPAGNVMIWNVNSATGLDDVATSMRASTQSYLSSRQVGMPSTTRSFFDTSAAAVNTQTVTSTLDPISGARYRILTNAQNEKIRMDDFMVKQGITFTAGHCFYEWKPGVKTKVQANKQFMVVNKKSEMAFTGTIEQVRSLIGLPLGMAITDSPAVNKEWAVYVQSNAANRNVLPFQRIFVLDPQAIKVSA